MAQEPFFLFADTVIHQKRLAVFEHRRDSFVGQGVLPFGNPVLYRQDLHQLGHSRKELPSECRGILGAELCKFPVHAMALKLVDSKDPGEELEKAVLSELNGEELSGRGHLHEPILQPFDG